MLGEHKQLSQTIADRWQKGVDNVATDLMVSGDGVAAIHALRSLATDAEEHNIASFACLTHELIARLSDDLVSGVSYLLKDGLDILRSVIQSESIPMSSSTPMSEMADLVADFVVEAREHLSQIEGQMMTLERDPHAMEIIHAVFRAFHTIKGLAGFFDFNVVKGVAHEVETLLDLARNGLLEISTGVVDVVLESGDFLLTEIASIDQSLNHGIVQPSKDNSELIRKIRAVAQPSSPQGTALSQVTESALVPAAAVEEVSQFPITAPESRGKEATAKLDQRADTKPGRKESLPGKEPARAQDASSVRVETAKLDQLMDMVGEMVIAQSLIRHHQTLASSTDSRLIGSLSHLARVTSEVQRATMSMRMIPVGQLFQRIERVIRDLSRKVGKRVVLETSGSDTEIDKTVAEELSDPLMHMVRNSVDHGVENTDERRAAGKSTDARIRLSAFHQSGQIVIQIADDGRGLNAQKIRRKAEERDLISSGEKLSDSQIYQLIFEPGFSTAEQVTDVSGRGVGMDVVRRNVEKLRGRIEIESTEGLGTTFSLKLPLTLAIIDGLIVEVGAQSYVIPVSAIRQICTLLPDTLFTIEGRDEMARIREELMPVIKLRERLGLGDMSISDRLSKAVAPSGLLVIVESQSRRFALLVDDLLGKQEVVIKSLGPVFKDLHLFSGCAVLADGGIGLILEMDGLFRGCNR